MTASVRTPPVDVPAPTRRRRRRWGRWAALVAVLLVGAAAAVIHSPWLSIRDIEIAGAERVDVAAYLDREGVGEGAIMVWVHTGRIEEAVGSDPWAAEVRVDRVFPSTLVVDVAEHTPALWIRGETSWMLVAEDGSVLTTSYRPGTALLRAALPFPDRSPGEVPEDPVWHEVVALADALPRTIGAGSDLGLEGSELWLQIPGHRVRLGHPIDLGDKGRVLRALLGEDLPPESTIDLIAPRRPAVVAPPEEVPTEPAP